MILVLVHPGSFFGSGADQVDPDVFANCREALECDLEACEGIVVVDGFLSDAIPHDVDFMIRETLERCRRSDATAIRAWGCDAGESPYAAWEGVGPVILADGPEEAGSRLAAYLPPSCGIVLTGAWATRNGRSGCVNAVADGLMSELPYARITISEKALYEEFLEEEPSP